MLKGIQIIRLGLIIIAISSIIIHIIGFSHEFTSFLMGLGCSLNLVGAGKRFVEMRGK